MGSDANSKPSFEAYQLTTSVNMQDLKMKNGTIGIKRVNVLEKLTMSNLNIYYSRKLLKTVLYEIKHHKHWKGQNFITFEKHSLINLHCNDHETKNIESLNFSSINFSFKYHRKIVIFEVWLI